MATQAEQRWIRENAGLAQSLFGSNPANGQVADYVRSWYRDLGDSAPQLDETDRLIYEDMGWSGHKPAAVPASIASPIAPVQQPSMSFPQSAPSISFPSANVFHMDSAPATNYGIDTDPPTYGSTGEDTTPPPGYKRGPDGVSWIPDDEPPAPVIPPIPINDDPTVVGSSTWDPTGGLGSAGSGGGGSGPYSNYPIDNSGIIFSGGSGGIFGGGLPGQGGVVLPIPGIGWPAAIGASILLSGGNPLGGGGSVQGTINQVGNIIQDPIGSTSTTLGNLGNTIGDFMGPQAWGSTAVLPTISFPGSGGSTPSPNPIPPPNQPPPGSSTTVIPVPTDLSVEQKLEILNKASPIAPTVPETPVEIPRNPGSGIFPVRPTPGTNSPIEATVPPTPVVPIPTPTPVQPPVTPVETPVNPPTPVAPIPTPAPTPNPSAPNQPPVQTPTPVVPTPGTGGTDQPPTPSTPVVPTPGSGSPTTVNPVPILPMPDTSVASPLDRNYYNEGNQSTYDLQRLLSGMSGLYGSASQQYGQTDFNNWQSILNQFGAQNSALTGQANAQTVESNNALRQGNVNDIGQLGGQALGYLQQLNPNQYAALNQAQAGAGALGSQNAYQQQLGQMFGQGAQFSQVNPNTGFTGVQTQFSGPQVNANTGFDRVNAQNGDAGLNFAGGQLGQIAPSSIQQLLEKQAMDNLSLGGSLSDQESNLASQTAREAWGARGLINSQGAVGDEILNTDALSRQRLMERQAAASAIDQQGFGQRQQGFTNALGYSNAAQNYGQMGLAAQQSNLGARLQGNQLDYNSQLANQNLAAQLAQLGLSGQQSNLNAQLQGNQLGYQGQVANQNAGLQAQQQNYGLGESLLASDYGRQQQNYSNLLGNAQLQTQAAFNPFATITSANTANQGTNQALFGNTSALSSGQLGNQYVEQAYNPFNAYSGDVYGSNFNSANARNIAASNNAAAAAGANTAANSALANSFLKIFGQYVTGGSCWVARSVFGADNPSWVLFRHWMLNEAPAWFRELYLSQGEETAKWLDANPEMKPGIRAWMESRIAELGKIEFIDAI